MDILIPKRHCCKREQTRSLQPLQARTGLQQRMGCTGWHVSPEMMGPSGAVAPGGRAQHPLPAAGEGGTASRPPSPAGRAEELLQVELAGQKAKSMGWEPQNPGETGAPKAAVEGEGAVPLQSSWYLWPLRCPHGAVPVTHPQVLVLTHLCWGREVGNSLLFSLPSSCTRPGTDPDTVSPFLEQQTSMRR